MPLSTAHPLATTAQTYGLRRTHTLPASQQTLSKQLHALILSLAPSHPAVHKIPELQLAIQEADLFDMAQDKWEMEKELRKLQGEVLGKVTGIVRRKARNVGALDRSGWGEEQEGLGMVRFVEAEVEIWEGKVRDWGRIKAKTPGGKVAGARAENEGKEKGKEVEMRKAGGEDRVDVWMQGVDEMVDDAEVGGSSDAEWARRSKEWKMKFLTKEKK